MSFQAKMFVNGVITTYVDGERYCVTSEHPNYKNALEAYRANDAEGFVDALAPVEEAIVKFSHGKVEVKDGVLYYNGTPLHGSLVNRIVAMKREGFDVTYMINFLENLLRNPSNRAVNEAYNFLEHEHLPITEDGCFLAYKTVRDDFYSKTGGKLTLLQGRADGSGRIYNGVGEVIECVRNEVDDVAGRTCSVGLHVGALEYAGPGGSFHHGNDRSVIVKVNPQDIVSVPVDYDGQKMRVCKYEVIDEYKDSFKKSVYTGSDEDYDYYDDETYFLPEEMAVGHEYVFTYENEVRQGIVEKSDELDEYVIVVLSGDESNAGQYRRFNWDKMLEIEEV